MLVFRRRSVKQCRLLTCRRLSQAGKGGGGHRQWRAPVIKENENLERLYTELAIVPEDEKEEFWAAMRRELPSSFRFTGSKGYVTIQLDWLPGQLY